MDHKCECAVLKVQGLFTILQPSRICTLTPASCLLVSPLLRVEPVGDDRAPLSPVPRLAVGETVILLALPHRLC